MTRRGPPGLPRLLLFAIVTVAAVLVGGNTAVEWLERRGTIDTQRRDDVVQFVNEPLFERDGDHWRTSAYAHQSMVPARFAREKPQGTWRAFLLGGSFMMGTPYVHQDHGGERPGGVGTWLRELLRPASQGAVEIVNLASGAASSQRVAHVAEQAVQLQPDVLVVASCNNEGEFPPSMVREVLHKQGAYRLLSRMLISEPDAEQRPVYARQSGDVEVVRTTWMQRLTAILRGAEERGVAVVLCTLPVNLRYDHTDGKAFERGFLDGTRWEDDEGAPPAVDGCNARGVAQYDAGDLDGALATFQSCEADAEALRFAGLVLAAKGEPARALPLLEQSVELVPRNRCRPSFNDDIRALAAEHEHVVLADLDAAARAESPGGLPGDELFTDYCHMNWRGYALMAETIAAAMERAQFLPAPPAPIAAERREELRQSFGLQPLSTTSSNAQHGPGTSTSPRATGRRPSVRTPR